MHVASLMQKSTYPISITYFWKTTELKIFFYSAIGFLSPPSQQPKKRLVEFWKLVITSYNHHSTFFPIDPKISCCKRIFGVPC